MKARAKMDMMSEEELIDQIVENRELIAQQNMLGSEIAGEVMKWYCMWYACPKTSFNSGKPNSK